MCWTVVLLASLASAPPPSSSEASLKLGEARAAMEALDYERALRSARAAQQLGDAGPRESWALWMLTGEAAASMGDDAAAQAAFSRALVLIPGHTLAPLVSPRIRRAYEAARSKLDGERLSASVRSVRTGERVRTVVELEQDPLRLVEGGRVYARDGGRFARFELARTDRLVGEWRCGADACEHFVALVDAFGNELLWLGGPEAPLPLDQNARTQLSLVPGAAAGPVGPDLTAAADVASQRPWYRRPEPYVGAAAAFAAAGGYFGWRFSVEQDRLRQINAQRGDFALADAQAADQARRTNHTLMFVAFGSALAAGAGALWVW